ncbi:hypothetical protein SAMN05216207_101672 [Pseudonocardia ammonioxydans]|uniref:Uncharacterized protein n=1 Tax=Pseudonocardia ammonioxydans TaxID=260086 RepID=A0A1I4ZXY8_PSUAM|nr:hypothetical protein [Pseudonocardia ammonioxydans]SFN54950.1 hypothetical protein SAMN05216207_101672 [Pseudonocardia ammonioxydans]
MGLTVYLGMLHAAERTLAESWRLVADGHAAEADLHHLGHLLGDRADARVARLAPLTERYGERYDDEPERLEAEGLGSLREGPLGLLRDLQDLYLLASFVAMTWDLVGQAAQATRDREALDAVAYARPQVRNQMGFLRTRLEQAAPQALAG